MGYLSLILILCICLAYLVLLLNRTYLAAEHSLMRNSTIAANPIAHVSFSDKNFFFKLGRFFSFLIPDKLFKNLESQTNYLGRDPRELIITIGQNFFIFFCMITLYYFSKNSFLLGLGILIPIINFTEIPLAVKRDKAIIDNSIVHIVKCIRILVVNTETPLINALEKINRDLPNYLGPSKKELSRILEKAEKSSMKEALIDWRSDSNIFKDFLALLVSIHEGASKAAIKNVIENFLEKAKEEMEDKSKNHAENLQIILIGPTILMLMIAVKPMMDAVTFAMGNSMNF